MSQHPSTSAEYEYYRRIKLLGEGAFGKAYLVECVSDCSKCVIKQIDMSHMSEEEKLETVKEARILEVLKHPNIIRFREVYRTKQGKVCIVMDYADGGDLSKKIQENKNTRFSENQILDWFTQICLALKHVHDRKILHRDLKTQNIFLTKDNTIKLGDFGIARILSHTHDKAKTMVGTPYYLSPEIIENMPYSFKSDIWSLGIILYELCCLEPPFNADSLSCLALRIVRGNYSPIGSMYSKDLRNLVGLMLQNDPNKRPSVHQILKMPVVTNRIKNFLSESIKLYEFSHTIFHKKKFVDLKDIIPDIKPDQFQNNGPKGYAHYALNPYNLQKPNPNAMDYLPGKKDLLQNNNFNHNPNPFISPKNDFFYKESPIQQPSYKNDFNDKRKHAVSPSPRYRESNILEKNNNIDKFLKREPQKPNYKPDIFNKPKENNSFLPPSASNKNKDAIILKTPYKDQKRDEKEKKQNNNSYQELINKNEVCITEPGKMAKKTSEQKFENLKKKYNIKDKEEENKKQEPQRDKIREFERKQMMNDIEQKRSVHRKKSEDLLIEWVGPIKPKKDSNNGEKCISVSEGKENYGRGLEKKNDFTNFEEISIDTEEEKVNIPINETKLVKTPTDMKQKEREKIKDKSKEKEKPKENEFFENLKLEINEKISICTERETEISQILIELQDIVSGKDLPEDQEDFENKMKTIKEDDREEREDDLNELKESQNELKQMALSKKKNTNSYDDKENILKYPNKSFQNNLQNFIEELIGKEDCTKILADLKQKLKKYDILQLHDEYGRQDGFAKLFPFVKKDELEKNLPLLLNYALFEKENEMAI